MRKTVIWSVLVLLLALFPGVTATAAGAQVNYVYRNFGGANAAIPDTKLSAVRSLGFVTSVTRDSMSQPTASGAPGTSALPGRPYWLDEVDAERNTTYTGAGVWVAVL